MESYSLELNFNNNNQLIIPKETWALFCNIGLEFGNQAHIRILSNGDVLLTLK